MKLYANACIVTGTLQIQDSTSNALVLLSNCICPGHEVTYQCTVCGGGATVWTGSLFDWQCPNNIILLRHMRFYREDSSESLGGCNNGTLTAKSIEVITTNSTSCFVSQLSISASISTFIENSTIECVHNNGTSEIVVDMVSVTFTTGIHAIQTLYQWYSHV